MYVNKSGNVELMTQLGEYGGAGVDGVTYDYMATFHCTDV